MSSNSHPPLRTGLPVTNPTKSYWQTLPLPISDHRTTQELPPFADYVIIGSGITGTSIAYKLLYAVPSANILMLEARTASSGATGRNGGHCRPGRYLSFTADLAKYGADEALKLEALEETNVKNVAQLICELGIDCDLVAVETVDVFIDPLQWEDALATLKARRDVVADKGGVDVLTDHRILDADEARSTLLFPQAVGAVAFPAYTLSPYKLVCGLLDHCVARGLNLQTNTPVISLEAIPSSSLYNEAEPHFSPRWTIHTPRGAVQAQQVILATNAYTGAIYAPASEFIIPTRGQIAVVRPGSKIAGDPVLRRSAGIYDVKGSPYYHSRAPGLSGEGDIVMGGGRTLSPTREQPVFDDSTIHPVISAYLTTQLATYLGADTWGDAPSDPVVMEWTGIMGYTKDAQPIVGPAPGTEKGLWICAGFHGHGMALTFQCAEAIVQMLLGHGEDVQEWLPKAYRAERILEHRSV